MDRRYEDIRAEVFELDRDSQQRLVEELEQEWSEIDDSATEEAARRMDAYKRGETTTITAKESIAQIRNLIADHKQGRS